MEAIKTRGVAKDGVLTVRVPHQFDEQELEVIVLSVMEKPGNPVFLLNEKTSHDERMKRLMSIVGTAKYPDAPLEKYDEYDQ